MYVLNEFCIMNNVNLQSNFELKGEWFLPNKNRHKVYGILTFNPYGNIRLDLSGDFGSQEYNEDRNIDIILGITDKGEFITLYNCAETSLSKNVSKNGLTSASSYVVLYFFKGVHIDKKEDLVFTSIAGEIHGLSDWLDISGLSRTETDEKLQKIGIKYELPKNIEFEIDKNCNGCFKFISNLSESKQSVSINQKVQIRFHLNKYLNFYTILDYLLVYQNFLTLAFYEAVNLKSIKLYSNKYSTSVYNETVLTEIELYYSPLSIYVEKPIHSTFMIFSYKTIKDRFSIIIKEWYKKYTLLDSSFDLLFEQFHKGKGFSTNNFLNLAQAAESFHSRLYSHTKIPKADYDEMKKDIMGLVPPKYHLWLKNQFNFGNNLNLHDRLIEILDRYSNPTLDRMIPDKDLFIKQIKDSRNYYTHYSKSLEKKALKGNDLYKLSQRIKILLTCAFLMECGFDSKELETALNRVKHRYFYYLADWN